MANSMHTKRLPVPVGGLATSLDAVCKTNWFDGIHKLPNYVNEKVLDECCTLVKEFIESKDDRSDGISSRARANKSIKQTKIITKKSTNNKKGGIKNFTNGSQRKKASRRPLREIKSKKKMQSMQRLPIKSARNQFGQIKSDCPCCSSAFPCFRVCGPINCPKNKLPMPRDLWYRIVCSQALEQHRGNDRDRIEENGTRIFSDEFSARTTAAHQSRKISQSLARSQSPIRSESKSNSSSPIRQQTLKPLFLSTAGKMIKLHATPSLYHTPNIVSFAVDDLDYVAENLPINIDVELKQSQRSASVMNIDSMEGVGRSTHSEIAEHKTKSDTPAILTEKSFYIKENPVVPLARSAHEELPSTLISENETILKNPEIHRNASVDATLEQMIPIPSAPSVSVVSHIQSKLDELATLHTQSEQRQEPSTETEAVFEHPLANSLFESYGLNDLSRNEISKRLDRRLLHIRQTLAMMSANEIEIKLKYKRDALIKKRQIPLVALTRDERIAMAELDLNVYEYVQALDEPSSTKRFRPDDNGEPEKVKPFSTSITSAHETDIPIDTAESSISKTIYTRQIGLPSHAPVLPVAKSATIYRSSIAPSVATFHSDTARYENRTVFFTVQPSTVVSQSIVPLSTTSQFVELSERTEKFSSWNHPLLSGLMSVFDDSTPSRKVQIHKQLARRYEHMCKKIKELNGNQLQAQIDSKSKALQHSRKNMQPNEDERLRMAELELCIFELAKSAEKN